MKKTFIYPNGKPVEIAARKLTRRTTGRPPRDFDKLLGIAGIGTDPYTKDQPRRTKRK